MNKEEIEKSFLMNVEKYSDGIQSCNSRIANKANSKLVSLYGAAKKNGEAIIFQKYLSHENENVRLWAAVFSLESSDKEKAEETLKDLCKSKSIISITAELTLRAYYSGAITYL